MAEKRPLESLPELMELVRKVEDELAGNGRVLLRYSGTEPKARIMVEGEDEARVMELAQGDRRSAATLPGRRRLILGIGVAYVDVPRFEAALRRHGLRLQERLFTPGERDYAARRTRGAESLAVRFAAKLAARRALGVPGAHWREIEVVRRRGEAPQIRFHGRAAEAARRLGVEEAALTLTHDPACCIGQVVLEGLP